MGVLACPDSWAPLPNLLHPQLQLQQRWRLPASATSCSSSTASEHQQQQQHQHGGGAGGMMAMLLPQRWETAGSGNGSLLASANLEQQIGMQGYGGMNLDLLPQFAQQQQMLSKVPAGGGGGGSSLSAFLEQRNRQLLQMEVEQDVAHLLHWNGRQQHDFSPPCDGAHLQQQHSSCRCGDNMGGCDAEVVHWADHIQHAADTSRRGGGGGPEGSSREQHQAHGHGDMDAFEVSAAFQFGEGMGSDYGVHHWLKEPEPSDLLLDYLTATTSGLRAAGTSGVDTELHDCKLIGIQDYLPDLDQHDPCRLVAAEAGPPDLDVSVLTSDAEPEQQIVSVQQVDTAAGHDVVELRFGDLDCAVVEAFKAALPAAKDSSLHHHPAGAALSRSSSRRRLSMVEHHTTLPAPSQTEEPGLPAPEKDEEEEKVEDKTLIVAATSAAPMTTMHKSRKTAKSGALGVKGVPGRDIAHLGLEPPPTSGLESVAADERSKRKTSASGPAQQKRSRKAAAAAPNQDGDKPTQRRTPARTSQAAASRKRSRQSEQPTEPGAAAADDEHNLDSSQGVLPVKKGSRATAQPAARAPNTKRRRTSPAAATSAAAGPPPSAVPDAPCDVQQQSACKPQPSKKSRRSPRGGAARAPAAPEEADLLDLPPSSERESHVIAERRRRRSMNFMLSTLGSLLPAEGNNPKPTDRLKVVAQTISYIKGMQLSMKALTQKKAELTVAQSLLHSTHHVLAASGHVRRSPSKNLVAGYFPEHPSSQNSSTSQDEAPSTYGRDSEGGSGADMRLPSLPVLTLDMFGIEAFITLTCAKARPDFFWKTLLLLDQLRFKVVTAQKSTNDHMAYHSIHVNNKESDKEKKDLKSALERLINSVSAADFHD